MCVIAFGGADHCQRAAGASCGGLNTPVFLCQIEAAFSSVDERQSHSIFHATRRIGPLPFHKVIRSTICWQMLEFNEGRVSNGMH